MIRQSYCYANLSYDDFMSVIDYLSGKHISLEDRYVYAKIWHDPETGMVGKKGRLTRMIYMTNIGTIPDETSILVKVGENVVGTLDEAFLERLRKGDVFVLGGSVYQFRYAKGMVAYASSSVDKPPTVPSWFSEMLPLSYDLANEIGRLRRLLSDYFRYGKKKNEILAFIREYLYVEDNAALAIYEYFYEQFEFFEIPTDKSMIIERYDDGRQTFYLFHSMFGRRVNDCLSRAVAYAISKLDKRDVEIGVNDNGFLITSSKKVQPKKAFSYLRSSKLELVLNAAIDKTEVLRRRFRHNAARAFMILRNYKGKAKRVGKQQVSSQILINAVKRISFDFPILKEARREVLEDLMDVRKASEVLEKINNSEIKVTELSTPIPSPFSFNLMMQGFTDILKVEDKIEFLNRMHKSIISRIKLKEDKGLRNENTKSNADSQDEIRKLRLEFSERQEKNKLTYKQRQLVRQLERVQGLANKTREQFISLIKGQEPQKQLLEFIKRYKNEIKGNWPHELSIFALRQADKSFDYESFWDDEEERKWLIAEELKDELRMDFLKASRRSELSADMKYEIMQLIDGTLKDVSDETLGWIRNLVSGTVSKKWGDKLVLFFRDVLKKYG